MYQLKDLIHINRRFQSSVNIQLDLGIEEKINNYIPSQSSLVVLRRLLEAVVEDNAEKAVVLIGPYGKGKSHLLLVLLYLLSGASPRKIVPVLKKIEAVDEETAKLIRLLSIERKPMLPVLVSVSEDGLNHDFLIGLLEALKREGMEDILPDTVYGEALKRINDWREQYPDTYDNYVAYLRSEKIDSVVFENRLKHYQEDALRMFQKLYPRLTSGSEFQPLVQSDALKLYADVNRKLCSQYGYGGLYLVFDEFSKYVEGHEKATFAKDMKVLQDMCELASSSKEEKLYITLVAHKSIREYGSELPKEMVQSFRGVEGRLKEIPFVVSAHNHYELIKTVIGKKPGAIETIHKDAAYQAIVKESYTLPCFQGNFTEESFENIVGYGCFPLLPVAAYTLLHISEKAAQNERSIFTFLANEEPNSLVRFVEYHEKGKVPYGTPALIYDYFEGLFRRNQSMPELHGEWLKADYALQQADTEEEKTLIKTMAIFLMLRNPDEVPANDKVLRLALGYSKEQFASTVAGLKKKQLILWRTKTGMYNFKNQVGVDIEKEMKEVMGRLPEQLPLCELLREVSDLDYVLPRQYNQEYAITRYFRYEYMTQEQFLHLKSGDILFKNGFADGKIIALIRHGVLDEQEIKTHLEKLNDKRLVLLIPKLEFDKETLLRRLMAVRKLAEEDTFLENNRLLVQELELYQEDLLFELNVYLEQCYLPEHGNCEVVYEGNVEKQYLAKHGFNRFLGKICNQNYKKTPIINNELINRQQVSNIIRKARGKIIKAILQNDNLEKFKKGTSAEATIYRAMFLRTGLSSDKALDDGVAGMLQEICKFLDSAVGEKQCVAKLFTTLMGMGYGVRKGVIPVYLAKALSDMPHMVMVFLKDVQTELSETALNNMCEKPEDYFLYIEEQDAEKAMYLELLEKAFCDKRSRKIMVKQNRMGVIVADMQDWCRGIPKYTRETSVPIQGICDKEWDRFAKVRKLLLQGSVNAGELLFDKFPTVVGEKNYKMCGAKIIAWKIEADRHIDSRTEWVIRTVKQIWQARQDENLRHVFAEFCSEYQLIIEKEIFSGIAGAFLTCIKEINTYDERWIADSVAKSVTGFHISDWTDEIAESFGDTLSRIKEMITESDAYETPVGKCKIQFTTSSGDVVEKYYSDEEEDGTAYFMQNSLENVWEEFGDTLSKEQKLAVVMKVIEKYIV